MDERTSKLSKLLELNAKRTKGPWMPHIASVPGEGYDTLFVDCEKPCTGDDLRLISAAANNFEAMLRVIECAQEFKKVYDKVKERGLIGQRDLYKWYQDEADLFYPLFNSLAAFEEA